MVDLLRDELAELLRIPADRLDDRTRFADIGVDSLTVRRLLGRLEDRLDVAIPVEAFFTHRTIGELGGALPAPDDTPAHQQPVEAPIRPAPEAEPERAAAVSPGAHDVAIIGLAGRYPKARTLDEFWINLGYARDCTVEIPEQRWKQPKGSDVYCAWGGFLDDVDRFDAARFSVSPRAARFMDPQERLFLEIAATCLEDAGWTSERLDGMAPRPSVGVFVGATFNNYQLVQQDARAGGAQSPVNSQTYSIANRVSYVFDLDGPSMVIDTACSSSLVALHTALKAVLDGECDMALAGGVNLSLHPSKYRSLCDARFASTDGHCRAFGEGGDGYVPGEGVGAVLLKSLQRAEADGDHIYAVVKGSAVTNDGRTFGYSVPSPSAQAAAIRRALDKAGVDARTVSYLEAHGTGTKLGDPIEIAGLTAAFAPDTDDRGYCAIGSVKSNIGHLEAAAGIAGLTKILLQLEHHRIAPSLLHADRTNRHIDFDETPFHLQLRESAWERPIVDGQSMPRRAGLSSFGAGGVNAHIVVEEYLSPQPVVTPSAAVPVAVLLSAPSPEQLRELASQLADHLAAGGRGYEPADIAHTLATGRQVWAHRLAFVAHDQDEMVRVLRHHVDGRREGLEALTAHVDISRDAPRTVPAGSEAAVSAWLRGDTVDFAALNDPNRPPRRLRLPTVPFAGDRYWPEAPAPAEHLLLKSVGPVAMAPTTPDSTAPALITSAPTESPFPGPAPARAPAPAGAKPTPLRASLRTAPASEHEELIVEFLQQQLVELLEFAAHQLPDPDCGFFDMGMESVMVARFRQAVEQSCGLELSDTVVFEYPSVAALGAHLVEAMAATGLELDNPPDPPTAQTPVKEARPAGRNRNDGTGQATERASRTSTAPIADELHALLVGLGEWH